MRKAKASEEEALIEAIAKSSFFSKAPTRMKLLRHLFEKRSKPQSVEDLAEGVWETPINQVDPNQIHAQCAALRRALKDFAAQDIRRSTLRCELPEANLAEHYHLRFRKVPSEWEATLRFWDAHLKLGLNVVVIGNAPLFFRDRDVQAVFRYSDMNQDDTEPAKALEELRERHREAYKETLECAHLYLPAGEVFARDHIERWFDDAVGVRIASLISRNMTVDDIVDASPVLLGNARTNRFMRDVLESSDCAHLGYKIRPERFGVIEIQKPTPKEMDALRTLPPSCVRNNGEAFELIDNPGADRYVFGLVTRVSNPYGDGAVTIIAADYTRFLEQITRSLTDEQRFRQLTANIEGKDDRPRQSFQMLFKIRVGVRTVDDERRKPELLAWRTYPDAPSERSGPSAA